MRWIRRDSRRKNQQVEMGKLELSEENENTKKSSLDCKARTSLHFFLRSRGTSLTKTFGVCMVTQTLRLREPKVEERKEKSVKKGEIGIFLLFWSLVVSKLLCASRWLFFLGFMSRDPYQRGTTSQQPKIKQNRRRKKKVLQLFQLLC
jgi:hypothetical protein